MDTDRTGTSRKLPCIINVNVLLLLITKNINETNKPIAARKIIDESEFKGKFIHTFGHGIGMDVHQDISIYSKSDQILRAGNVVSAEPGIYIPGVGGIRIEDTCLITEDGCEVLTSFDHSFTVV